MTQQSLNRLLLSFVSVRTLTNTMAVEPEGSTPPEPKPTASTILCQLHVFLINTVHLAGSVSVFYPFFFFQVEVVLEASRPDLAVLFNAFTQCCTSFQISSERVFGLIVIL